MQPAQFYRTTENQNIKCELCPRECVISPGNTGHCRVRQNKDGKLYSIVYARPNALNVDPIEKKPIYHILPGAKVLSVGTIGCNLNCKFCQNWNISCASFDSGQALELPPARVVQMALHYEAEAIAFTYNEPGIFAEYVIDTSIKSAEEGLLNIMVSNGYISKPAIPKVYQNIHAANIDLKAFDENFYKSQTNASLKPVLDTLITLKKLDIWIEITNLIIPGFNDDFSTIKKMCEWILENLGDQTPIHFTAFHPDHKMLEVPPTTPSTLLRIRDLALETGLQYIYCGNISSDTVSNTYCPQCGEIQIKRTWLRSSNTRENYDGVCSNCNYSIAGIFQLHSSFPKINS